MMPKRKRVRTDPATLGIRWRRLVAFTDEATATLLRCAFSRNVTDGWDFSCALFDCQGRMIVQPTHGLPAFLGCLALTLADVVRSIPRHTLRDGESYILNDPWRGTGQVNDLTLVTPLFSGRRLMGFAANVSHAADLGGRILSGDSRETFEEGLRLPLMRAFIGGRPNPDLFELLRLNSRVPDIVLGDLQAQLAANLMLRRRVLEFLRGERLPDLDGLASEVLHVSEMAMCRAIRDIPDGVYRAEVETDGFDRPIRLVARVTVAGERIAVDYTGTSPQDPRGINSCFNYTYAETVFPLICVARPASLINGGTLRPLRVFAPPGTVLNPQPPAALGSRVMVSQFLQAVVFRALAQALPDRVIADCGTPAWLPVLAGTSQHGTRFVEMMFLNGGFGARPDRDGISCLGWPCSFSGTPVEFTESEKPILIHRKELVPDSGGAGTFRGGLGQAFVWQSRATSPLSFAVRGDRIIHPPMGLEGGLAGAPARVLRNGVPVHSKETIQVDPGDVLHLETPGSGGFEDPRRRARSRVEADVADGYVTDAAARELYGWGRT
ncbi:MAG: hydantoinase B/oxoprolinase family protein [Candidatus Rokubacteria bacterium]|nr:hydantoinase B/oxoprolinase family protein [Candidatus Rokubacteria bacterium]